MESSENLKRQLQWLKKELKGWEGMFEKKHGHKPTKTDIEESPDEIRETYQEYKKAKSRLSGKGSAEKKVKRVHFEDNIEYRRSPSPLTCTSQSTKEDGVFGISLNKKPKKKMNGDFYIGGRREGERKSVWKLRRWSKGRGHHTVVVKKEGEKEEEKREDEEERVTEEKDQDMAGSTCTTNMEDKIECDLTAELEQLSQGVHFKDLTTSQQDWHPLPQLNSLTEDNKPAAFVPVAGQCSNRLHFKMASRSREGASVCGGGRLKHCRNVSQKWLERCKPDLAELDSELLVPSEKLSVSEGEVERSSEEEREEEIEEVSELEDSDGLCEEDLWEEEEEREEEQGVEPEAFDLEEHICDSQGEERHSPLLRDDDLNRMVGNSNLDLDDRQRGYSWDDNDEGSSHGDSSSEDDPVINSSFGEQFGTKWEELSNSVTTLSPLKLLPVVKSTPLLPQITTSSSQSSKKRLILTPRTTPIPSQSSVKTAPCHTSVTASTTQLVSTSSAPLECSTVDTKRTGVPHLRDGMSLLELYGSKGDPVASRGKSTLSLVQQLSLSAESANQCRSDGQSSDKRMKQWTLQRSAHVRNFVDADINASSSVTQKGCGIPKQISTTDLPSHQSNAKPHPPFTQTPVNPTSNREEPRLTAPGSKFDSILATLDHEIDATRRQNDTGLSKMANFESDIDLLSQEEPGSIAVSMATTSRGRSLRRERERVHSMAAVLREVERLEHREEADKHAACGESGLKTLKCGVEKHSKIDERERKVISSSTKPASASGHKTTTPSSTADSGGSTSSDMGHGGRRGKAVSDNFVRLNMKVKKFSKRPGRSLSGSAYKRHMWKKRQNQETGSGVGRTGRGGAKKGGRGGGRNICFKCGKPGHWAKNCTDKGGSKNLGTFAGEAVKFDDSLALGREDDVDSDMLEELAKNCPFPTVQEAAMMATGIKVKSKAAATQSSEQDEVGETSDDGGEEGENADSSSLSYVAPPPCHTHSTPPPPSVESLYPLTEDGHIINTPKCVFDTLRKFGYSSFRPGQEEAIMNILSGVSTLVIHSTGSGKSLCYQLPAYLYSQSHSDSPCITLVISPLVSLMEDQVRHFPPGLKGACLHTNQTRPQREKVLCDVVEGRINVLLLSPEALVGGAFWSGRASPYSLHQLPPVAFACIDEVHCVSEWSHNFRPSYLRIHKVLRERLGVHCVLGLTATATHTTALSVADHLGIDHINIIRGSILPGNLHISVSCDQDRDQALVELLQSPKFRDCESIIIYCTRQQQTERVAQLLRTCLQSIPAATSGMGIEDLESDPSANNDDNSTTSKAKSRKRRSKNSSSSSSTKRRKMDWSAESYHAGMAASQRKKVQNDFMSGRVRIVVATVAFGMGLNKADVRAIIHYNMPKSFESFVQEIGRAGRDGLSAYCHVFIDKEGSDICELRRHAYSNTVDPYMVKQLVGKAFPVCYCKEQKQKHLSSPETPPTSSPGPTHSPPPTLSSPRWCVGHEVAIPIEEMVQCLDIKEECISTLLCYLELRGWLEVLNVVNDSCSLKCYGGARQLRALAQKVPAVAAAAARLREKGTDLDHCGEMTFSVIEIANSMGWESHIVRSELSGLQYNDRGTSGSSLNGARSTVLVEFSGLAFHIRASGDFAPEERDHVCEFLTKKVKSQEEREVEKVHLLHAVLQSISQNSHINCERNDTDSESGVNESAPAAGARQSQSTLRDMIHRYFSSEGLNRTFLANLGIPVLPVLQEITPEQEQQVRSDVHSLVAIHSDLQFTGRMIARIFHGIVSPLFPAEVWGRQYRFWRKHLSVDFNTLCQVATMKLLELR